MYRPGEDQYQQARQTIATDKIKLVHQIEVPAKPKTAKRNKGKTTTKIMTIKVGMA